MIFMNKSGNADINSSLSLDRDDFLFIEETFAFLRGSFYIG